MFANNWRLVAVIVLTIAVAVGATTTVLSVATPVLLKALPLPDSDRLDRVEPKNARGLHTWISVPTLADWQTGVPDARFMGYSIYDFSVFGDQGPEAILAARVTEHFFDILGVQPTIGRAFDQEEHRVGGPRSVLLTYGFWQRRYGGDPNVIGRLIDLAGPSFVLDSSGEYRVIGVLPPDFWLFAKRLEIVIPLRISAEHLANRRRGAVETVLAKVNAGVSPEVARGQLASVVQALASKYGTAEPVVDVSVGNAQSVHFREFRPRLLLALVSAAVMFALAFVNVAATLIALAVARQKEFSIRAALGISRGHLLRQSLTEGLLLGILGGLGGLLLGSIGTAALRTVVPGPLLDRIPGDADAITVDARVMTFIALAVVLMSTLSTVTTFFATGGARLVPHLRDAARGTTSAVKYGQLRTFILAPQVALAVALVVTTGILSASLLSLESVNLGMNTDRLISYWLNLDPRRYADALPRANLYERIIERVRALPDVEAVSAIDLPSNQNWQKTRLMQVDDRATEDTQLPEVFARAIAPNYFKVLGIRVVEGRAFSAADTDGTMPVAIVSRSLADRLWPGRDPIGQQLRPGGLESKAPWLTVVGVAADVRRVPHEPPPPTVYRPLRQNVPRWLYLMIRTRSEGAQLTASLQEQVWTEDPRQPVEGPYVIKKWVREMTALLRFIVLLGLSFSVLGFLLAFSGVYGLTSDLSQRAAREIGIRKALGATTGEIIRLYIYRCLRPALPAVLAGAALGTALIHLLASGFEGVVSWNPAVTMSVIVSFGALVVIAAYLGSRRAAGGDPAVAMRVE